MFLSVDLPVDNGIAKRVYGQICQEVCPWNVSFANELREPAFRAREILAGANAPTLARDILLMQPSDYASAFKGSAIKRAKLWMLKRNACVVLGNTGTDEDHLPLLEAMLADDHDIVRQHAAWAIASHFDRSMLDRDDRGAT